MIKTLFERSHRVKLINQRFFQMKTKKDDLPLDSQKDLDELKKIAEFNERMNKSNEEQQNHLANVLYFHLVSTGIFVGIFGFIGWHDKLMCNWNKTKD